MWWRCSSRSGAACAVALGNVDAAPRIEADLVYAKEGREDVCRTSR
ncbi:MAG: hypothetical protein IPP94_18575 [Ignavibacteria bacterium]|nr:hypothetical protein [Ignavibacteria bacterium]